MSYFGNAVYPVPLVNPANIQIITTSTALGATSYGITYLVQATGNVTITMPLITASTATEQITLVADSATGTITVNASGTNMIRVLGVTTNTFTVTSGDVITLENNGTSWSIVNNSSWKADLNSPSFTGTPLVPQAAQFNSSNQIASTAAVNARGLQAGALTVLTGTTTLTATNMGQTIGLSSTTAFTVTLPGSAVSTAPSGTRLEFINYNTASVTVQRAGTDVIVTNATAGGTSLVLGNGDTLTLESTGSGTWLAVAGSVQIGSSAAFGHGLTSNGYQKLPSGMILQWGSVSTSSSGYVAVTYPIAFPTALGSVVATFENSTAGIGVAMWNSGASPTATFVVAGANSSNAYIAGTVSWMAVGY